MKINSEPVNKVTHTTDLSLEEINRAIAEMVALACRANLNTEGITYRVKWDIQGPRFGTEEPPAIIGCTCEIVQDYTKFPRCSSSAPE